nr:uncharacterized protein LOC131784349 [Pocillopora verrucosa]
MDRHIQVIIFAAFGLLLNFVFQSQQNNAAFLVLLMHYQQAFQRLVSAVRRRRVRLNRRRLRNRPWSWTLPRPAESWLEIHFGDRHIPEDYFRRQLRMKRGTFQVLVDILTPWLTRENTRLRDCIPPEKVLALDIYRLAHGNSYVSIRPAFNVGKSTVIEAVQDVVAALFELKDECIHFPQTVAETTASIGKFEDLSRLPNILSRNSLLSSSSPSSTAARFLFLDCLDCFFLSVLASRASFFFGSPWLCSFLSGWASKSSEPAGESALLLCDMFSGLELPLVPASDTFRNITISQHPKIASISL